MKKRIVRITAALCAAALLAGCGSSIGSKDGGYYAAEAAAQESYANYDSAAGSVDSGRGRHRRDRTEDHLQRQPFDGVHRL